MRAPLIAPTLRQFRSALEIAKGPERESIAERHYGIEAKRRSPSRWFADRLTSTACKYGTLLRKLEEARA
jgi:hypothetical protein